jgi:hypothetical protein
LVYDPLTCPDVPVILGGDRVKKKFAILELALIAVKGKTAPENDAVLLSEP